MSPELDFLARLEKESPQRAPKLAERFESSQHRNRYQLVWLMLEALAVRPLSRG